MAEKKSGLEDYREVPERIIEWYARHPDARITTDIIENTEARVVVRAAVFKTADPNEPPSGVGHSYLDYPGKTNFTRGSELENAETSAVGRALVMAGIPSSYIASQFEVTMKSGAPTEAPGGPPTTAVSNGGAPRGGGPTGPPPPQAKVTADVVKALRDLFPSAAKALEGARTALDNPELGSLSHLTNGEATTVVQWLTAQRDAEHATVETGSGYGD